MLKCSGKIDRVLYMVSITLRDLEPPNVFTSHDPFVTLQ
jgi:hypothetical protein